MAAREIPVRVLEDPPSNLATLGSALNLACILEIHRGDLEQHGHRHISTSRNLLFTKLTALVIHLAFDRRRIHEDTMPWRLARELLLPVESLAVRFTVQVTSDEQDTIYSAQVLAHLQTGHHESHGRQPHAPTEWTVSRTTLHASPQLVTIPCAVTSQPSLPRILPSRGGSPVSPTSQLRNQRRYEVR
ncbi:hypothetical protein JCM11251_003841 [Rhodosporidiobolus azoricus]